MRLKLKEFNIYIDETILIVSFLCVIFKGIREYFENYFVCFLFITFHEFAHMFIASVFGIKTKRLCIRISGLNINLDNRNKKGLKWLIIFLAGPVSNILLAIIFNNISMVYTINLALAIINLIPIYPLDGYNILEIILEMVFQNKKSIKNIQKTLKNMVIILLVILGIYQFVFLRNVSIILMIFYIIIQSSSPRNNSGSRMYQKYYKNITNF